MQTSRSVSYAPRCFSAVKPPLQQFPPQGPDPAQPSPASFAFEFSQFLMNPVMATPEEKTLAHAPTATRNVSLRRGCSQELHGNRSAYRCAALRQRATAPRPERRRAVAEDRQIVSEPTQHRAEILSTPLAGQTSQSGRPSSRIVRIPARTSSAHRRKAGRVLRGPQQIVGPRTGPEAKDASVAVGGNVPHSAR